MDTWVEWFSDVTSPKNLLSLLLPYSKGRIDGRGAGAGYWSAAEAQRISTLGAAGRVSSGTEVVAQSLGLQRALSVIGSTRCGEGVQQWLTRKQQWEKSLGWVSGSGLTVGKFVGGFTMQCMAVNLAEEHFGPETAFLLDALLQFAGDTDSLARLLEDRGVDFVIVQKVVRQHHVPRLRKAARQVIVVERVASDLESIVDTARQGKPLTPVQKERLAEAKDILEHGPTPALLPEPELAETVVTPFHQRPTVVTPIDQRPTIVTPPWQRPTIDAPLTDRPTLLAPTLLDVPDQGPTILTPTVLDPQAAGRGANRDTFIPTGDPAHDATYPITLAVDDLHHGVDSGAGRAAGAGKDRLRRQGRDIQDKSDRLESMASGSTPTPSPDAPEGSISIAHRLVVDANLLNRGPNLRPDSALARAELALAQGDAETAFDLYREAVADYTRLADLNAPMGDGEFPARVLSLKLGLAKSLKQTPTSLADIAPAPRTAVASATAPLAADRARQVAARGKTVRRIGSETGGAGGVAEVVEDGGETFVRKFWVPGDADRRLAGSARHAPTARVREADDVLQHHELLMFEGEVIGSRIMRLTGYPAPEMRCVVAFDAEGRVASGFVVSREIRGTAVGDLSPADVHALAAQHSEQRAVSIVLGDHDRHPKNYMAANGTLMPIDFGLASPRGIAPGLQTEDGMQRLADVYYARAIKSGSSDAALDAFSRAEVIQETAVTYQHALPGLERMQRLLGPDVGKLRGELEAGYRSLLEQIPEVKADPERLERLVRDYAADALDGMAFRTSKAETILKSFNRRNGIPLEAVLPRPPAPKTSRRKPAEPAEWRLAA
jgi:hypothetical protein